ncbi:DUF4276 family protein [Anatilimnocola sp. NA78]|uniref:DUF4276 family protein n=1 Tax=Anatilimnocola sp. NA78 TaxID=3415683 RepID=UPI003CE591D6
MKEIAIFVEGGGDSTALKADLRTGFDQLLSEQKNNARAKRLGWKLSCCGGRDATCDQFLNAVKVAPQGKLCVLLVDSEEATPEVTADDTNSAQSKAHLTRRDGWNLSSIPAEQIHLMVQCMEAWIVADPDALAAFYGKDFRAKKLPARANLESEPKLELCDKLVAATRDTQKQQYHKTQHGPKLLRLIAPDKVKVRCPHFKVLTDWLDAKIASA